MCDDATKECVDAHDALIEALAADLAALKASDDATNAQEQAAQEALDEAKMARSEVQMDLDDVNRDTETGRLVTAAETAANRLDDNRTASDIMAAEEAIMAAKQAFADGDEPDAFMTEIEAAENAVARAKARNAVDNALMTAESASRMLQADQSPAAVMAARANVDAAKKAVMDNADDLTDADESGFNARIRLAEAPVIPLEDQLADRETEGRRAASRGHGGAGQGVVRGAGRARHARYGYRAG